MLRAAFVAVPLATAVAADPSAVGEWVTEGGKARVRIEPCAADPGQLCGAIVWSYRPDDAAPSWAKRLRLGQSASCSRAQLSARTRSGGKLW